MVRHTARLLTLVAVAFGVMSMHTLGHADQDRAPHAAMAHAASALDMPAALAAVPHTVPAAAAVPLAATTVDGEPSAVGLPMPAMDPTTVCLAVLTTVGVVVLLAGLLADRRTGFGGAPAHRPLWTVLGRGPPFAVPSLGQRLAILSVSRT
jgi:hypothetical protein